MASLTELTRVFGRIGVLSFGGPAAQIGLMHKELVEDRPWLSEKQFLNALSFCMLLPGPEAMQLATFAGWRLRGIAGGLIAGGLFVLPGALVVLALAWVYAAFGQVPLVQALFAGVQATVVVIVLQALRKVAQKALNGPVYWAIAGLSFAGIFLFNIPFPVIILIAAILGALFGATTVTDPVPWPRGRHVGRVAVIGLAAWGAPLALAWALNADLLLQVGQFFSTLAVVTFGGAYAVLAYMTQAVVAEFGWLTTPEMIDGLGLAETTPGPLILVTEFVGFVAGAKAGGVTLGLWAAAMTLWVTFVPCFIWIFTGAPYIDWISAQPRLTRALSGITAAVVGVILNLSIWFAVHVFFADIGQLRLGPAGIILPDPASLQPLRVALAVLAAVLILRLKWGLPATLGICAALGAAAGLIPVGSAG